MRDKLYWLSVAFLVLAFVLVCAGLVRTMQANDAQFDTPKPPPASNPITTTEIGDD